jgi:hypothetical protein
VEEEFVQEDPVQGRYYRDEVGEKVYLRGKTPG